MDKTDRELLKDALELKVQIRNLSSEEQKEILLNKISEIRECLQKISLAFEPYELTSRQKEVESLGLIEDKDIADTYWEIYDFIDDYDDDLQIEVLSFDKEGNLIDSDIYVDYLESLDGINYKVVRQMHNELEDLNSLHGRLK